MKRILGVFLSLVIVLGTFSVLPVTVSAEGADEIMFKLNDDGESYSVTAYIGEYTDKLSIPSKYNGLPVTKIARFAFEHNDNIGSMFIPATIEEIDERAFYSCDYLKSFSVSSKSKYFSAIDGVLFNKDQTKLVRYPDNKKNNSYTIPEGTKYIGACAFEGSAPDRVILSEGVLSIGESAFAHSGIEEIVFSDTVTEIEKEAFEYCESLETLALPASLEKIGASAFWDCDDLTSFTVASGSKYFSVVNGVLFNKAKTKLVQYPVGREAYSYTIPDGVKYIGAYAFASTGDIEKIVPSAGLVSIGDYAFAYCNNLATFNIPDTVTKIGSLAFWNCNITKAVVPEGVTELSDGTFYGCGYLYSVTLPEGLKNIGDRAFFWCSGLKKLTIPSTVTSIGDDAFRGCSFISIKIPENVIDIGQYAFFGCQLSSIEFPDSVKNIGKGALFWCENLKSVTIGKGLENIDVDVFAGCENLESIKVDSGNKNFVSVGGVLFNKAKTELIQYPRASSLTSYTVPDGVEKIWVVAFSGSDNLISVVLPDSVTDLGESAFYGCDNLSSVKLGNGLKVIGETAFYDCKKLTSITIPASVTHINEWAFNYCENLSSITIKGNNIKHIGAGAFANSVYYNDSNNWENGSLYLNNCLLEVDRQVKGMYRIKDNTKVIAEYALQGCNGITAVSIPDTVTDIGCNAFRHCTNIKSVFIPKSVVYIGHEAFWDCNAIENIYYTGSQKQWKNIEIDYYNPILEETQIHYNYVCAKPTLKSIENTQYGVLTKWGSVEGADRYRVYRKTSKSDWKYIGYSTNTYYTDKTAKSGVKYYYAVRAISGAGNSPLSSSLSVYHLEAPSLNTPSTSTNGVGLRWSKVNGAEGYLVYRKEAGGSYSRIATEKGVSNVTYRDTTAKKGTKYYYKVKAYYSKTQSACSDTKSITDKY